MSPDSRMVLYAELLVNIRHISIIAALPTPSDTTTALQLSSDANSVVLTHRGDRITLQLPAKALVADCPSGTPFGTTQPSWRIPIADELSDASPSMNMVIAPWTAKDLSSASIDCRNCGGSLIAPNGIDLWKDLPSENWAEMMDFWHCHKPEVKADDDQKGLESTKAYGANNRIGAQRGTGFVNLTNLLLHDGDCTGPRTVGDQVVCKSCSRAIGYTDLRSEDLYLYKWSLTINGASPPTSHFVSAHIHSQIAAQAVQKFIVHSDNKSAPAFYIWVFSPRLIVSLSPPIPLYTQLDTPTPVCKILFQAFSADSPQAIQLLESTHSATSGVDEILFPADVVQQIADELRLTQASLPEQARKFREWEVGLLGRCG